MILDFYHVKVLTVAFSSTWVHCRTYFIYPKAYSVAVEWEKHTNNVCNNVIINIYAGSISSNCGPYPSFSACFHLPLPVPPYHSFPTPPPHSLACHICLSLFLPLPSLSPVSVVPLCFIGVRGLASMKVFDVTATYVWFTAFVLSLLEDTYTWSM